MTDYKRGFEDCRKQCLALAEDRMVSKSILAPVLDVLDDFGGTDMATEHEWFGKGRISAAARIAADIRAMTCTE